MYGLLFVWSLTIWRKQSIFHILLRILWLFSTPVKEKEIDEKGEGQFTNGTTEMHAVKHGEDKAVTLCFWARTTLCCFPGFSILSLQSTAGSFRPITGHFPWMCMVVTHTDVCYSFPWKFPYPSQLSSRCCECSEIWSFREKLGKDSVQIQFMDESCVIYRTCVLSQFGMQFLTLRRLMCLKIGLVSRNTEKT